MEGKTYIHIPVHTHIQLRSMAAGQLGHHRSTPFLELKQNAKLLPCPGHPPESFLSVINTIFPKFQALTLGFESRQQSTELVVESREPRSGSWVCHMCTADVCLRCLQDFCGEGKSALFCRMRCLSSSFVKVVLGSRGWC